MMSSVTTQKFVDPNTANGGCAKPKAAKAIISSKTTGVSGTVSLSSAGQGACNVLVKLQGLPAGYYNVWVHTGSVTAAGGKVVCENAQAVLNPTNVPPGATCSPATRATTCKGGDLTGYSGGPLLGGPTTQGAWVVALDISMVVGKSIVIHKQDAQQTAIGCGDLRGMTVEPSGKEKMC